jgi:hypothetical protein
MNSHLRIAYSENRMKIAELEAIRLRRAARKDKIAMLEERHHLLGQQISDEKCADIRDGMLERDVLNGKIRAGAQPLESGEIE